MKNTKDFTDKLGLIKLKMLSGVLTYEEAKKEAEPIINEMNQIAKKIAKKFGRKHFEFTFSGLMR